MTVVGADGHVAPSISGRMQPLLGHRHSSQVAAVVGENICLARLRSPDIEIVGLDGVTRSRRIMLRDRLTGAEVPVGTYCNANPRDHTRVTNPAFCRGNALQNCSRTASGSAPKVNGRRCGRRRPHVERRSIGRRAALLHPKIPELYGTTVAGAKTHRPSRTPESSVEEAERFICLRCSTRSRSAARAAPSVAPTSVGRSHR